MSGKIGKITRGSTSIKFWPPLVVVLVGSRPFSSLVALTDVALRWLYFCIVFSVFFIPLPLAQDENQFIYHGFHQDPQLSR